MSSIFVMMPDGTMQSFSSLKEYHEALAGYRS